MKCKSIVLSLLFPLIIGASAIGGRLAAVPSGTAADLHAAAYHPAEGYYLVVGEGVYTYDGSGLTSISGLSRFYCCAWRPQGDYALIAGEGGLIYKYDGSALTPVGSGTSAPLMDIEFSPSGDQAVIVGYGGTVLVYDSGTLHDRSPYGNRFLEGVTWKPDGSAALIVGIKSFATEEVLKWDRSTVTVEWSGTAVWPGGISYHPNGGYAIIIEDWGHAARYDASGYTQIETGFEQETDGINSVQWNQAGTMALITGAWSHAPFPGRKTLVEYDGERFNVLRMFQEGNDYFEHAAWNAAGTRALVVGLQGRLAVYHSEPPVMGAIYCEKDHYFTGETLKVCVDVINGGGSRSVDIFIDRRVDFGARRWWPAFGTAPVPFPRVLPAGLSVEGRVVFEKVLPAVPAQSYINWELWILDSGSRDLDDLYVYGSDMVVLNP